MMGDSPEYSDDQVDDIVDDLKAAGGYESHIKLLDGAKGDGWKINGILNSVKGEAGKVSAEKALASKDFGSDPDQMRDAFDGIEKYAEMMGTGDDGALEDFAMEIDDIIDDGDVETFKSYAEELLDADKKEKETGAQLAQMDDKPDANYYDDETEDDTGGPSYANVPKGAKSSAQAKIMKKSDEYAKSEDYKDTKQLVQNGNTTELSHFLNNLDDNGLSDKASANIEKTIDKIENLNWDKLGFDKSKKVVDKMRADIMKQVQNPKNYGGSDLGKQTMKAADDANEKMAFDSVPSVRIKQITNAEPGYIKPEHMAKTHKALEKAGSNKAKPFKKLSDKYQQIKKDSQAKYTKLKDKNPEAAKKAFNDGVSAYTKVGKDMQKLMGFDADDFYSLDPDSETSKNIRGEGVYRYKGRLVRESVRPKRSTIKEIAKWIKGLEESRYKKVSGADSRRVAWFVNNNLAEDYESMPKSIVKKWPKAAYGRERYLAKEFMKYKKGEQQLRESIRGIIKKLVTEIKKIKYKKNDWKKYNKLVDKGKSVMALTSYGDQFAWEEGSNHGVFASESDGREIELSHNDIDMVEIY